MNALDEQHLAFAQLQAFAIVFALACGEVIFRNLYLFPGKQRHQVALHGSAVNGGNIVEIISAVGQLGSVLAVYKIVVGRERDGTQTACLELHREALAEGAFARARRPGDEHHAHRLSRVVVAAIDVLGYLHHFFLLQGFAHLNQFASKSFLAGFVHGTHVLQAHYHVPAHILGKHAECLGHRLDVVEPGGVFAAGYAQQQAVVVFLKAEHRQIARRGHQRTIVVVHRTVQNIVVAIGLPAGFQQPHLVGESLLAKDGYGILGDCLAAAERHVGIHNLTHTSGNALHIFRLGIAAVGFAEVAEIAARNRVFHIQPAVGEYVLACLVKHKAQRAHVSAHATPCANIQKLHVAALIHPEL